MHKRETLYIAIVSVVVLLTTFLAVFFAIVKPKIKSTGMKTLSNRGLNLIKRLEGLELTAYKCSAGVPTIGYGHTKGVKMGDTCTEEQAEEWLKQDVKWAETAVNRQNLRISQNQFDALVSFVFNMGEPEFLRSTLLRKIKANPDDPTIADEFARWKYAGGVVVTGLVNRRTAESNLYFA